MRQNIFAAVSAAALCAGATAGTTVVIDYNNLAEGFLGASFSDQGITYRDVNGVGGVFPNGDTFVPADMGFDFIIEDATFFYDDFPTFGTAPQALTFGTSFIGGPNLTIGPLVQATMDLDTPADFASVELGFFENGPWGGIQIHLEAYMGAVLVGSDSLTIAGGDDLDGRDNPTIDMLSISPGATFDTLYIYSTFDGQFSAPRVLLDNLTLNVIPAPGGAGVFAALALFGARRRRASA